MSAQKPHITPMIIYLGVGATLLFLTVVTVLAAGIELGVFNLIIAVSIASMKAAFVGLFFMHLAYDNKFYAMIFLSSILFLAIFISLTMLDTMRRGDIDQARAMPIKEQAVNYSTSAADSSNTAAATQPQQ